MSGRNQASQSGSFYEDLESDSLLRLSDISINDWMRNLGEVELFEVDLQHLILNYLTINGLAEAAEEFVKEARIEPQMPLHCIDCRAKIREAILSGRTDEAIRQIGFIDPNLLSADAEVTFLLHKQQLLKLIETGELGDAIDFAQRHLAPCVKECPHLLPHLEEAMALLAFSDLSCPEAQRLIGGMEQREETARRIDEAILDLYRIEQESALELLAKNILFSQGCLQNAQRSLCPVILDIRRGTLGKILSPPPGRGQRLEETTDSKGIHSGGEVGALQIDVDASPQQETSQGEGRRPSQTSTGGLLAGTIPRRTQDRDQSRDFGRRRRTGMPPP